MAPPINRFPGLIFSDVGTPTIGQSPTPSGTVDFSDPGSWVPFLAGVGLQTYATVARNDQAGQQISQGQQPTALLVPATPTGVVGNQTTPANALAALTQTTGLSSAWLMIIGLILLLFFLFKK